MNDYRPVFIIGAGRSGTTLLKDLLNNSKDLKVPPESHFLLEFYKLFGHPHSDEEAVNLLKHLTKHYRFKRYQLDVNEGEIRHFRNYADFMNYLYTKFATKYGASRWCEKTPHYINNCEDLLALFPHAKFIHLIRDGRDVANSVIAREWGPNNILYAANYWKSYVTKGIAFGEKHPDRYLEIKYEDLLSDPERIMKRVYAFIEVAPPDDLRKLNSLPEDGYIKETKNFFGKNTSYRASYDRLVAQNKNKWADKMTKREKEVFNTVAGDLLYRLGYVPSMPEKTTVPAWEKIYALFQNAVLMVFKEFTSPDVYRRMANPDIFPVIRSSKRILQKK